MKNYLDTAFHPNQGRLSLIKLHATACLLMTQFHYRQCPKLAHFIVRHIRLLLEHPDMTGVTEYRTQYLQLLNHWQHIATSLNQSNAQGFINNDKIH